MYRGFETTRPFWASSAPHGACPIDKSRLRQSRAILGYRIYRGFLKYHIHNVIWPCIHQTPYGTRTPVLRVCFAIKRRSYRRMIFSPQRPPLLGARPRSHPMPPATTIPTPPFHLPPTSTSQKVHPLHATGHAITFTPPHQVFLRFSRPPPPFFAPGFWGSSPPNARFCSHDGPPLRAQHRAPCSRPRPSAKTPKRPSANAGP